MVVNWNYIFIKNRSRRHDYSVGKTVPLCMADVRFLMNRQHSVFILDRAKF